MSKSRATGTAWEVRVRDYLRTQGWPHAERLALNGSKDRGDFTGIHPGIVLEAKAEKRVTFAEYLKEVETERDNAEAMTGAVVVKLPRRQVHKAMVLMSFEDYCSLLRQAGYGA